MGKVIKAQANSNFHPLSNYKEIKISQAIKKRVKMKKINPLRQNRGKDFKNRRKNKKKSKILSTVLNMKVKNSDSYAKLTPKLFVQNAS